jgi:hypothetical protein
MLPASSLAEAGVFGEAMLQAIDWALDPDEGKRPQDVAVFRAAIQGAEKADPSHVDIELAGGKAQAAAPSQKRNLVCTIMFLDLVGYSQRSVEDQVALKKLFSDVLAKALKAVP